eukprot:TRINITY_DN82894_c0_g1_i1.p1 TRINITY_DN82894_c0_g1~~TRINITY_DN82894_c0_g1_i1.p1  ORF type:complete len:413 (-),score=60.61 TRINITY_DN82894_c0_g1_i1:83-1321(-)
MLALRPSADVLRERPGGEEVVAAAECRLDRELRQLSGYGGSGPKIGNPAKEGDPCDEHRDWRKLEPADVIERFKNPSAGDQNRTLLSRALFSGTAQALVKGSYWAPFATSPVAKEVDCRHLRRPVSRLYPMGAKPSRLSTAQVRQPPCKLSARPGLSPLDVAGELWNGLDRYRIAVVRTSAIKDPRNELTQYSHLRDDQLFLRTSYYQAFEKMDKDLDKKICNAIDDGGLIYTPGVGVLRGPIEQGAEWHGSPPRVDVMWMGLKTRPSFRDQSQYALEHEKKDVEEAVERLFAWAAACEVDVLIMPPIGCGTNGVLHPHLDMADIIHHAWKRYERYISQFIICSDHPAHLEGDWWQTWQRAVTQGREPAEYPIRPLPPCVPKRRTDPQYFIDKAHKMQLGKRTPRTPRHTFL